MYLNSSSEESIPVVTFAPSVGGWRVLEDWWVSDNQYIGFEVIAAICASTRCSPCGWNIGGFIEAFGIGRIALEVTSGSGSVVADTAVNSVANLIDSP